MSVFGDNLRTIRRMMGLSRQQLANKIGHGVSKQSIGSWEDGKAFPQMAKLPWVCRAMGFNNPLRLLEEHVMIPISPSLLAKLGFTSGERHFDTKISYYYQENAMQRQFRVCCQDYTKDGLLAEKWYIEIDGHRISRGRELLYIHQVKDHFAAWAGYELTD